LTLPPSYNGVLVAGYATVFTTGPVFSLVLDEDVALFHRTEFLFLLWVRLRSGRGTVVPQVSEANALRFPEVYRELQKRRYLSVKTFLIWTWKVRAAIAGGGGGWWCWCWCWCWCWWWMWSILLLAAW